MDLLRKPEIPASETTFVNAVPEMPAVPLPCSAVVLLAECQQYGKDLSLRQVRCGDGGCWSALQQHQLDVAHVGRVGFTIPTPTSSAVQRSCINGGKQNSFWKNHCFS